MSEENIVLAILFADISGSTGLYDKLGDERAHKLVSTCLSVLSEVVARHSGTIIKTIGDEVMCTFENAEQAVNAAIGMHKAIVSMPPVPSKKTLSPNIRVGLHMGPVIRQGGDVFGDAVNVASRMVSLAKPRQIITTQQTVDALPGQCGVDVKCLTRTTIRGKGGEFTLYEVIWDENNQTMMLSRDVTLQILFSRLHLRLGNADFYVDKNCPTVTLGRHAQNDLVVDDVIASRSHARIEYQRGRFVLIDQSTNGTYVSHEGEKPTLVHQDEIVLGMRGYITLGREEDADSFNAIHFSCEF
ncbi:MAG TPA: adenylate/guanylate cyclase domain-containing protein [Deltaproteobacteria bacterium]|nr:adenylate/guanylate cyclase domain-containing protein [Deltaproteobacteria bacterium]HPR55047.1 adenylate/guanylate cyclase domain-containing protein [Deltaproteobacteria bacterium]